ncbi:MAG: hypothetical protein RBS19_00340 [Bacteroidales bacterium]|nr:hypothetical protein [Bacteroidales bacterium]
MIIVAGIALLLIGGLMMPKEDEKPYNPDVSFEAKVVAVSLAEQSLRNPETADLKSADVSKNGQTYTCTGTIVGQNDFGVKQSADYRFVLKYIATSKPADECDRKHWEVLESNIN